MHDWNALSFYRVDDDVAIYDWRPLVEEKDVSALHRRLHASTQDNDDWTLSPKAKLEHVPYHDSRHDDDAEAESLVDDLEQIIEVSTISESSISNSSPSNIERDQVKASLSVYDPLELCMNLRVPTFLGFISLISVSVSVIMFISYIYFY